MKEETNENVGPGALAEESKQPAVNPLVLMMNRQKELALEMEAKSLALEQNGFGGHTYAPGVMVEVEGTWLAGVSNFIAKLSSNIQVLQASLIQQDTLCTGIVTTGLEYQNEIVSLHTKNCEAGLTITKEAAQALAAKEDITEVVPTVKKVVPAPEVEEGVADM